MRTLIALLLTCLAAPAAAQTPQVDYDIVYVRQPRLGDQTFTWWPEVFHPARLDPGADLMLLHPDGSEEVLVAGGNGGVTDPVVSFDGQSVYFGRFPDLRTENLNYQRDFLPEQGADIWRIDIATRQLTQLTHGEFTPNTGAGHWHPTNPLDPPEGYNRLGYGVLNLGPMPLPDGRIVFTSNRNAFVPPKGFTMPTLQLFVMDANGENVEAIAPMTISSALHPTILRSGELMFSSHEAQGLRDERLWGIWGIWPDGRNWRPIVSAFHDARAFHFMTQAGDGRIVVVDYYNLNNSGFGTLLTIPQAPPPGQPPFHPAFLDQNPDLPETLSFGPYQFQMHFTPRGAQVLTPFTHPEDEAAPIGAGGARVGKLSHPSGAPGNDLLVAWSPGPVNHLDRPTQLPRIDSGIYLIDQMQTVTNPNQLVLVKNSPNYNEAWPRALVPYAAIHGIPAPAIKPWLPNDGSVDTRLPAGTPHGLVGSSSVYKRESFPGHTRNGYESYHGLDAFNTAENGQSPNWFTQGSDAGRYANSDIWALRIVAMEPNTHRSYGPNEGQHYRSHANERLRVLGEIPLRKRNAQGQPVLDPEGNPDTSFLVKLPADTPFTFQLLDRRGMLLSASQTWHQVRPGEKRVDCGGCHAHSQQPLAFEQTAAAAPGFALHDLGASTPLLAPVAGGGDPGLRIAPAGTWNVEFKRDIRPLLQRSCVSCHSGAAPAGNLDLGSITNVDGLRGDYYRLAADRDGQFGHPPLIGSWRQTNASRYIRAFQSRRSLLVWKLYGQRLDGWSNADHPTESVPGNPATLPSGADPSLADLDYSGTMMPPPGSGAIALSEEEKLTIVRWIDLGAPVDTGSGSAAAYGWLQDEVRPTLTVSAPRTGNNGPLTELRFGVADAYTGIDAASLDLRADFTVNGRAPGTQLADLVADLGDGRRRLALSTPITQLARGVLTIAIADQQGNLSRVQRVFAVGGGAGLFANGFE